MSMLPNPSLNLDFQHMFENPKTRVLQSPMSEMTLNQRLAKLVANGQHKLQYGDQNNQSLDERHNELLRVRDLTRTRFKELSPQIQNKFNNDPKNMLDFLANPANRQEAEYLGLLNTTKPVPPAASAPSPVEAKPPAAT